MRSVGVRYVLLVACTLVLFVNFIACGAQLYQVSMKGDHDVTKAAPGTNDPESVTFGLHAPNGWNALPVKFRVGFSMTPDQVKGLKNAIKSWETAVGRPLFAYEGVHKNVEGDNFEDLYSSLPDRINGDYLDNNWTKTGKPEVVLATTIWDNDAGDSNKIDTADIRYNAQYYLIGNAMTLQPADEREVVDMESLALHELGHLLGLAHMDSKYDSQSIMNPSLYIGVGLANRRLSKGDVERIHRIYGCQGDSCDVDAVVRKVSMMTAERKEPSKSDVESSASSETTK